MGQKVHPYGFRLGVNKPWRSRWFATRDYAKLLVEDVKLKAELKDKLKAAGVSSVEIERPGNKLRFIIRTARPGIVIGRKGSETLAYRFMAPRMNLVRTRLKTKFTCMICMPPFWRCWALIIPN